MSNESQTANLLRQQLLGLTDMVAPFHEWLAGERAYFRAQGYNDSEALAMSAATYVAVFGAAIRREEEAT